MPSKKERAKVEKPSKKEKAIVAKKSKAEDKGAAEHNWIRGGWRGVGHTAFDLAVVAAKAVAFGLHKTAVMIAPTSLGSGPHTKTARKKQAKDAGASIKNSVIATSAASLVSNVVSDGFGPKGASQS
jgi:hypothetical protein